MEKTGSRQRQNWGQMEGTGYDTGAPSRAEIKSQSRDEM